MELNISNPVSATRSPIQVQKILNRDIKDGARHTAHESRQSEENKFDINRSDELDKNLI